MAQDWYECGGVMAVILNSFGRYQESVGEKYSMSLTLKMVSGEGVQ